MTPDDFRSRLRRVALMRDLTQSDLSVWFARPRPTVRTWWAGTARPTPGLVFDECVRRLSLLEQSPDFPVPYDVFKFDRRDYIKKAFMNANNAGVLESDPAGSR